MLSRENPKHTYNRDSWFRKKTGNDYDNDKNYSDDEVFCIYRLGMAL